VDLDEPLPDFFGQGITTPKKVLVVLGEQEANARFFQDLRGTHGCSSYTRDPVGAGWCSAVYVTALQWCGTCQMWPATYGDEVEDDRPAIVLQ